MNYMNRNHIHLDPAADDLGSIGGAAAPSAPAGDAVPAAPVFDESRYVPVEKYQELERSFGETRQQYESRFRDFESRLPKPEVKEDKRPALEDYMKNGEMTPEAWEDYQEARIAFSLKNHRATWEKEAQEASRQEASEARINDTLEAHAQRATKYKGENPDYNPNASLNFRSDAITLAIADSDFSAHIHHFFQKNPDKLAEIRSIERDKGAIAALRYVGRLESQFENQQAAVPGKKTAAAAMTTAAGFGGNRPSPARQKTPQEIFDEHHK